MTARTLPERPAVRPWLLHMARDAVHLCRIEREAGQIGAALRWLILARHLRASALLISRPAELLKPRR